MAKVISWAVQKDADVRYIYINNPSVLRSDRITDRATLSNIARIDQATYQTNFSVIYNTIRNYLDTDSISLVDDWSQYWNALGGDASIVMLAGLNGKNGVDGGTYKIMPDRDYIFYNSEQGAYDIGTDLFYCRAYYGTDIIAGDGAYSFEPEAKLLVLNYVKKIESFTTAEIESGVLDYPVGGVDVDDYRLGPESTNMIVFYLAVKRDGRWWIADRKTVPILILAKEVHGQTDVDPSSGDGNDDNEPSFCLEQENVSGQKGSQFLSVLNVQGKAWTITCDADWIRVEPSAGRGDSKSISLSYDANAGGGPRQADIRLLTDGTSIVVTLRQDALSVSDEPESDWLELPLMDDDKLIYRCHYFTLYGVEERNYSYGFSISDCQSKWVAYPLNQRLIGSGSRTNAWGFDPQLPESVQPNVTSTFRGGWARQQLIPSASRLNNQANPQVFYATNIVPMDYNLNGEEFASIENKVRGLASSSDMCYVVAGIITSSDSSTTTDIDGKTIKIPDYFYKVVLRYSKSSPTPYTPYCALVKHDTREVSNPSISELELLTGMCFYPNLKDVVGEETYNNIKTQTAGKLTD